MIKANARKYSVSAMCRVLQVNRSTYYYEAKQKPDESGPVSEITEIFQASRSNYGTRKIKKELMKAFSIKRPLSHKGCPYDNAVAEATFKIIKTEFVWNERFNSLEDLWLKLWDYVNWYNHHRTHSSLGYQTPVEDRKSVV